MGPTEATNAEVIAAARRKAQEARKAYAHRPGPDELFTEEERANAAPFYFELRAYARQLQAAREEAGVSLAEVSVRSGIDIDLLSELEAGTNPNPSWRTLGGYAAVIGLRLKLTAE